MRKTLQILGPLIFTLNNVKVQDPGPTVGSAGSATFTYGGLNKKHHSVRAVDEHIWLQQNLGSSQVATSATDVDFQLSTKTSIQLILDM